MTAYSNPLTRSEKLTQIIRQEIQRAGGTMTFAQFMDWALYAPRLGYYCADSAKFGASGDFITAPEISPLFAQCIAQQCQEIFAAMPQHNMLELGAGSGIFARDLLLELERLNSLPQHYFIFEISPELRTRQLLFLQEHSPHLLERISWLDSLPKTFSGVIFANEVMDALPVNCFQMTELGPMERCVTWENEQFAWTLQPPNPALAEQLQMMLPEQALPIGYQSEVNLQIPGWIQSLAAILQQGVILLCDYGYGRLEYYHPDRYTGTLKCFYQHQHSDNPLILAGLQDITAHVDFTTVAENAIAAGLSLAGFTTQTGFLLACGLLERAEANGDLSEKEKFLQSQGIKQLTLPNEMGEIVKVMGLTRGFHAPLVGFSMHERRRNL